MALVFQINKLNFSYTGANESDEGEKTSRDAGPNKSLGRTTIFQDVSIQIRDGEITAIVGPSGIGKSTLLHILGLLDDTALPVGTVQYRPAVACEPIDYGRNDFDRSQLRRAHFGFALQSSYLMPTLTCAENMMLPLLLTGRSMADCRRYVKACVEAIDSTSRLWRRAGHLPSKVSGGERQRYAFLRAVIHGPRVLFADEPFSNIDYRAGDHLQQLMHRWQRCEFPEVGERGIASENQRSLLLVTHDLFRALAMAATLLVVYEVDGVAKVETIRRAELSADADDAERELRHLVHRDLSPANVPS